jgi:hypothetical protein
MSDMSAKFDDDKQVWNINTPWETKSMSMGKLAEALAKAQLAMGNAAKDSTNPHFRSKYADLASVREAVLPHLAANGIAVIQRIVSTTKDGVAVETMLVHSSGEWVKDHCWLPVTKADAQGFGSAITYARRYSLAAVAGIAAEDDDGNAAVGKPVPEKASVPPRAEQKAANSDKPRDEIGVLRNVLEGMKTTFNSDLWTQIKKEAQALKAKGVEFDDDFRQLYSAVKAIADKKVA